MQNKEYKWGAFVFVKVGDLWEEGIVLGEDEGQFYVSRVNSGAVGNSIEDWFSCDQIKLRGHANNNEVQLNTPNQKTREKMFYLMGQIEAIQFPLMWSDDKQNMSTAYYDLLESMKIQYVSIMRDLWGYEE